MSVSICFTSSCAISNSIGTPFLTDLVYISNFSQLGLCSVIPPLATSDHNVVVKQSTPPVWEARNPRLVWRYKEANLDLAKTLIETTNWDSLVMSVSHWQSGKQKFCVLWKSASLGVTYPRDETCLGIIRRRNCLYKKARKSGNGICTESISS